MAFRIFNPSVDSGRGFALFDQPCTRSGWLWMGTGVGGLDVRWKTHPARLRNAYRLGTASGREIEGGSWVGTENESYEPLGARRAEIHAGLEY